MNEATYIQFICTRHCCNKLTNIEALSKERKEKESPAWEGKRKPRAGNIRNTKSFGHNISINLTAWRVETETRNPDSMLPYNFSHTHCSYEKIKGKSCPWQDCNREHRFLIRGNLEVMTQYRFHSWLHRYSELRNVCIAQLSREK